MRRAFLAWAVAVATSSRDAPRQMQRTLTTTLGAIALLACLLGGLPAPAEDFSTISDRPLSSHQPFISHQLLSSEPDGSSQDGDADGNEDDPDDGLPPLWPPGGPARQSGYYVEARSVGTRRETEPP